MRGQGDPQRQARRKRRTYLAAALPVAIPLILAAVIIDPSAAPTMRRAAMIVPALRYSDLAPPGAVELPQHSMILTVEEDDTLDSVLVAGGLSRRDGALLTGEFGRSIDLRRIHPGNLVRFHHAQNGEVDAVQMRITGWGSLDAERAGDGTFVITPRPAQTLALNTVVAAEIDSSLYEALTSAGEQPQLVQQLVDVFQWDIDFF